MSPGIAQVGVDEVSGLDRMAGRSYHGRLSCEAGTPCERIVSVCQDHEGSGNPVSVSRSAAENFRLEQDTGQM
jgi:hypothetical protein